MENKDLINEINIDLKRNLLSNIYSSKQLNITQLPSIDARNIYSLDYLTINDLATSWDEDFIKSYTSKIAKLARNENIDVLTGFSASIVDTLKVSEDPVLTAKLLNAYIASLQSNKICCQLEGLDVFKMPIDFAKNTYLKPFEYIIKNANPTILTLNNTSNMLENIINDYFQFSNVKNCHGKKYYLNPGISDEEVNEKFEFLISKLLANKVTNDDLDIDLGNAEYEACLNSIVLMKNKNLLPICNKTKIHIVSDLNIFNQSDLAKLAKGYDNCNILKYYNCKDKDIDSIVEGIKDGICIVLLHDKNISNFKIAAHYFEAIETLSEKVKTIAVLTSNKPVDTEFDNYCDSLLLAPIKSIHGIHALLDIIFGFKCPCGKLAVNYPFDVDIYSQMYDLSNNEFIGYKYYEKTSSLMKYPFGFGLSYTTFTYSDLKLSRNQMSFKVKNTGGFDGSEIVQIYIGNEGLMNHPKKSLYHFEKITLKSGQTKDVVITLNDDAFSYFKISADKFEIENGAYQILVCSSCDKVELRGRLIMNRINPQYKTNKNTPQKSNIITDNFMFTSGKKRLTKDNISEIIRLIIMLLVNIGGMILAFAIIEDYLVLALLIFFILVGIDISLYSSSKKSKKTETKKVENIMFGTTPLEEIFMSSEEIIHDEIVVKTIEEDEDEVDATEYIDEMYLEDLTKGEANNLLNNIHQFVLQNGLYVSLDDFRNLLSAMAANKVILLKNNSEHLDSFVMLLNKFFNSEYFGLDNVDEEFVDINSSVNLQKTLKYAKQVNKNIVVSLIANVDDNKISVFKPIIENSEYRNKNGFLSLDNGSVEIPKNFWCIMSLEENTIISNIECELLANVVLMDIDIRPVEAKEELVEYEAINYYRFEKMVLDMLDICGISEENYKKIDALESYANSISSFKLGNKLNLSFERYMAMNLALEVPEVQVLDNLVSSKVLPMILTVLKNKNISDDNQIDEKLERIFGEDNIVSCQKVLRMNIEK